MHQRALLLAQEAGRAEPGLSQAEEACQLEEADSVQKGPKTGQSASEWKANGLSEKDFLP